MRNGNSGATIEEIKERCDIVDVIGRVVNLKKAGVNYKGLCPFHSEKTPSFVVSESKQRYTCFGCNKSGDVISFVQDYYNMDFMQALEKLAGEVGLEVQRSSSPGGEKKDELYEINRQAARFFYKALREKPNPGLPYMKQRGLDDETLRIFGIGWADDEWDSLYTYLKNLGYKDEKLLSAGLISKSNGKCFDKFRGRVIFPIQNTNGKVIGFGGRAMGDGVPKYLNSQESDVFKKKNNLYGLNITRNMISKEDAAILVEGYMDVISLYQAGVRNVSASLGTALTGSQARMLKRYTRNVILSYDADDAGINAALRGMDILKKEGCKVHILTVTDGKDPDEFIKKRGKEAYMELARNAAPFADFKLGLLKKRHDLGSVEGRIDYLRDAAAVLRELSPVEADIYIKKLAAENDISERAIKAEMGRKQASPKERERKVNQISIPMKNVEKTLLRVLLTDSTFMDRDVDFNKLFETPTAQGIFNGIKQVYIPGEEIDINKLEDILDEQDAGSLEDIRRDVMLAGRAEEIFNDCILEIERETLKEKEEELLARLDMSEGAAGGAGADEIMNELREVQKKLNVRGK